MKVENFSRQHEIFDATQFKEQVHIIGCGATGSAVALNLAKMGIENIHIYDFDTVEEHNLPNQQFGLKDIGEYKAKALQANIMAQTGIYVNAHTEKVTGKEKFKGIVFLLVDSMKARNEIFHKAIKYKPHIKMMIETRMALRGGSISVINPQDLRQCKQFEETLFSDEQAEVSACGHSVSIITSANIIANYAVVQVIKQFNGIEPFGNYYIDTFTDMFVKM